MKTFSLLFWCLLLLPLASAQAQESPIALPVTFEEDIDYELVDFAGTASQLVADPTDAANTVVETVRTAGALVYAGTVVGATNGLAEPIPFTATATTLSMRVWTPEAGTPVRLKVEQNGNGAVNAETEVTTTMAGAWETLVFDFTDEVEGTPAFDPNAVYDKLVVFFDFGVENATEPTTYYWDDIAFAGGGGGGGDAIALPVTFEDDGLDYELRDFGGNVSMLTADPTDAGNTVVQSVRTAGAEFFAGTAMADVTGLTPPVPFAPDATTLSLRVWTPEAGTPVRLKLENVATPSVSVEAQVNSTMAGAWETLVFDFSDPVDGTPALDFGADYERVVVFFDFGTENAAEPTTYYWDDLTFGGEGGGGGEQVTLPVTFDDEDVDYELADFGGNASMLVADPTDAGNTVVETVRTAGAEFFAGTTVASASGFAEPIPFAPGQTTMSLRVWTPEAGTPVRLKVEDLDDPTVSVEAELTSTMAGMWETLVFDFSEELDGTSPIDFDASYTKASVFFDFGVENAAEPTTYYWDDLGFGGDTGGGAITLPITFEEDIDYELVDFAGTASQLVADPTDAANTVVETVRTAGALVYAGTVVGATNGLAEPIPFTATATTLSMRVWTPEAGTPVRLKVEQNGNGAVNAETEVTTTMAGAWETLVFDFTDEVEGTPAFDPNAVYDKLVVFFDFGVENATEPTTYYWDDIAFGARTSAEEGVAGDALVLLQNAPNPFAETSTIRFTLPASERVALHVYNVLGQHVATLADGPMAAGEHEVTLDASQLASGVYVYQLRAGTATRTRSLTVTR